jgi:hypothetical protein
MLLYFASPAVIFISLSQQLRCRSRRGGIIAVMMPEMLRASL